MSGLMVQMKQHPLEGAATVAIVVNIALLSLLP